MDARCVESVVQSWDAVLKPGDAVLNLETPYCSATHFCVIMGEDLYDDAKMRTTPVVSIKKDATDRKALTQCGDAKREPQRQNQDA